MVVVKGLFQGEARVLLRAGVVTDEIECHCTLPRLVERVTHLDILLSGRRAEQSPADSFYDAGFYLGR